MTLVFSIDPGPEVSGYCFYESGAIFTAGTDQNRNVLDQVKAMVRAEFTLAIEMVASYGMPVGKEVFETVRWIGRFQQAWHSPDDVMLIYRKDVKMHLCGSPRAKDGNIRQALIDLIGPQGTKKTPGPTYGVKSHAWAALAVAVTAEAQMRTEA